MTSYFSQKLRNQLLNSLIYAWLTYYNFHACWSYKNNNVTQCVESEREALLKFKQGIRVDNCGLLDSWIDDHDCCKWRNVVCDRHSGHVTSIHLPGIKCTRYYHGIAGDDPDFTNYYDACLEGTISISLIELKHLKYLDLSCNNFRGHFPKFIGSLDNLEYLNLSNAGFMGVIPQEIGNLSRLTSLDLNFYQALKFYQAINIRVESLHWLSRLTLLRYLDLSYIDMSMVSNTWLPIVNSLPFLEVLCLDRCELSLKLSHSLSYTNSSSTLNVVRLPWNNFNDILVFEWLFNLTGLDKSLTYLDLSDNLMFGNNIRVAENAMKFVGNLCSLQHLNLGYTTLNYRFSDIIQLLIACPNEPLEYLHLGMNQLWGSIPNNIDTLSSLTKLHVGDNLLNGTISQALCRLSMLESLDLSDNSLSGVLTSAHLSNLSMLESLDLSGNSLSGVVTSAHLSNLSKLSSLLLGSNTQLVINISANWSPPFQLNILDLRSCKVGPEFPKWLLTQKSLTKIYLYNAGISSTMPVSFPRSLSKLKYMNMAQNMMYGVLPDVSITFDFPPSIDLSSNNFTGAIPPFLRNVTGLDLKNNNISQGLVPLLCPQTKMPLSYLDLSNNSFSDKLPDCWGYFNQLSVLHLENNKLWGNLPSSMGMLNQLSTLHLGNNSLSGDFPAFLANCTSLRVLDLAHNSLSGYIPPTFGSLKKLNILTLQNNRFVGTIPSSLCYFSQLQSISISNNRIFGTIPKCIYKLKGMATTEDLLPYYDPKSSMSTNNDALIMWKGKEKWFDDDNFIGQPKYIDFSNNMLEGLIPEGISSLIGLISINLSGNHLSGAMPLEIGQLTSLETLDLSHNHLSGAIPTSLAQISFLGVLDLSYNNLSGKIPTGTQLQGFDASYYAGNPLLCGEPLLTCPGDETPATSISQDGDSISRKNEHDFDGFMLGLYISVILGFIVGFWGVCGSLVLKRSWRHAFFRVCDDLKDRIYVTAVVSIARVWR